MKIEQVEKICEAWLPKYHKGFHIFLKLEERDAVFTFALQIVGYEAETIWMTRALKDPDEYQVLELLADITDRIETLLKDVIA